MAAQTAAASDQVLISASKTSRDYRLSLVLLVTGIIMVGAYYSFAYWANATGNYPTSIAPGVAISAIGSIGFVLILVGAIFTGVNWSLLRKRRHDGRDVQGPGIANRDGLTVAPKAAAQNQILLSALKTRRDYRLSLALLVAGIVELVAFSSVAFWLSAISNYPSIVTTVVISFIVSMGSILIVVGGIFTAINWSLLRQSRPKA